jgi:hypothetical protein
MLATRATETHLVCSSALVCVGGACGVLQLPLQWRLLTRMHAGAVCAGAIGITWAGDTNVPLTFDQAKDRCGASECDTMCCV